MSTIDGSADKATYCPMCGYDLRASPGQRCSECGTLVGRGTPSRIPWMHRQWRGRVRSYLLTAWYAVMRPGLFAQEWQHRLPGRDARAFFRITLALHVLLVTGTAAGLFVFWRNGWDDIRSQLEP